MSIGYSNIAKSYLTEAVDNDDTQFILHESGYHGFMEIDADYTYAVLINPSGDKEIVRVDLDNSSPHVRTMGGSSKYANGLTVARGQSGTSAVAWPRGTLIYIELTKDFLNEIRQKGQFRTVTYNPNGVLSPSHKGEKVYQSDNSRWWKSYDATNPYWALITGSSLVDSGCEYWGDPGGLGWDSLITRPTWLDEDTYWTATVGSGNAVWDGTKWTGSEFDLTEAGTWVDGFRPSTIAITHDNPAPIEFGLYDKTLGYEIAGPTGYTYTSGVALTCTFQSAVTAHDIGSIVRCFSNPAASFNITDIVFA